MGQLTITIDEMDLEHLLLAACVTAGQARPVYQRRIQLAIALVFEQARELTSRDLLDCADKWAEIIAGERRVSVSVPASSPQEAERVVRDGLQVIVGPAMPIRGEIARASRGQIRMYQVDVKFESHDELIDEGIR